MSCFVHHYMLKDLVKHVINSPPTSVVLSTSLMLSKRKFYSWKIILWFSSKSYFSISKGILIQLEWFYVYVILVNQTLAFFQLLHLNVVKKDENSSFDFLQVIDKKCKSGWALIMKTIHFPPNLEEENGRKAVIPIFS